MSLISNVLQIFRKPTQDTYNPQNQLFRNNDRINFIINQENVWILWKKSYIKINCTLEWDPLPANTTEEAFGQVTLINNIGPFLFDSISYYLNNTEIDSVDQVGLVSTVKTYLCFMKNEFEEYQSLGWTKNLNDQLYTFNPRTKKFSLKLKLSQMLNLPFTYERIMCGTHKMSLVRSRTDDNCYVSTGVRKARITITDMNLVALHVYPAVKIQLQLLDSIKKNRAIPLAFQKWEIQSKDLPDAKTTSWKIQTIQRVERPNWIIVFFQTERDFNSRKNSTHFDHINLQNIRLKINSRYIPYDKWRLDFTKNYYEEAYDAYTEFYKTYYQKNRHQPFLNYNEYKNSPLFIIDCTTNVHENAFSSEMDATIEIESSENFPIHTKAYYIIIQDRVGSYNAISEAITMFP
ncbi:hypothetical protein TcasGA2_TC004205 [Tribolium castaneum]|uniref:Double jelly roll-like domain-containing protein n=1 Tax=Tribolium castaneum TaxID=7070 RepID=D7EJ39_TRICA|nr:hypothetical protein TcasGA2_TC004205 [Tribolium castaneum]